jgi:Sulfotransferase domain
VHFFDMAFSMDLAWYRWYFPLAVVEEALGRLRCGRVLTGEATPNYLYHPLVAERVRRTLPSVKVLFLLRNPADRAYTHYWKSYNRGVDQDSSFEEAIARDEARLAGGCDGEADESEWNLGGNDSYLARGFYAEQLERWTALFPPEQLLVLRSEDLFADPAGTVLAAQRFLGLPLVKLPDYPILNAGRHPPMHRRTRDHLADFFRPHNRRLFELIGRDMSWDA